MNTLPFVDLHVRSYGNSLDADRHPFVQLVLPLQGEVVLDVEDRRGRLDPLHGAVVAQGRWHSQCGGAGNRSIIVDVDTSGIAQGAWGELLERPFVALGPAARKLVEYMGLMTAERAVPPALVGGWLPLLLDTLTSGGPQPRSRLAALIVQVRREPGLAWTTASMARCAGLSVSRLHALFRAELDTSPHAWLLRQRIDRACEWLAESERTVADIALGAGFSDQSALTRAMRAVADATPAMYRRQSRQNRSKKQ